MLRADWVSTWPVYQSRTQGPLAFWSAGGRQERLWGTGILLSQGFLRYNNGSHSKNLNFFEFSWVSPGAHPLIIKPEDSGYEIACVKADEENAKGKKNINSPSAVLEQE